MSKKRLLMADCLISALLELFWLGLLALARRTWFPELDARWLVGSGFFILVVVMGLLMFFQGAYRLSWYEERER